MHIKENGWEDLEWILVARNPRDKRGVVVKSGMTIGLPT